MRTWVDEVLQDLREDEQYREFAYPDPLSKLAKKVRARWGFIPARTVELPGGLTVDDGKPWTVGYGYTHGVTPDTRFSKEMAEHKLRERVQDGVKACMVLVPNFKDQPDAIKTVLVNMEYQLGSKGLGQFRNTLNYIKNKNYLQAAANMEKSLWYRQTPNRARRLIAKVRSQATL